MIFKQVPFAVTLAPKSYLGIYYYFSFNIGHCLTRDQYAWYLREQGFLCLVLRCDDLAASPRAMIDP